MYVQPLKCSGPHRVSLDMWHVSPGTRYTGQYMCVATNSVTTTETTHNFTGVNGNI